MSIQLNYEKIFTSLEEIVDRCIPMFLEANNIDMSLGIPQVDVITFKEIIYKYNSLDFTKIKCFDSNELIINLPESDPYVLFEILLLGLVSSTKLKLRTDSRLNLGLNTLLVKIFNQFSSNLHLGEYIDYSFGEFIEPYNYMFVRDFNGLQYSKNGFDYYIFELSENK